ncbi:MAG: YeeE/YedE family protein [Pseudomonadales bacterium]|nr:YeeE/YedE family protein [Pseudomonadales bacterium]
MNNLIALIAGCIFGGGLAFSGMTDTSKVIGFLDLAGTWQPGLAFVMGAGLLVATPSFYLLMKGGKPFLAEKFFAPENSAIDKPLLIGAALFGIGWGLYGYCPGPAISSLAYLNTDSFIFVGAMLVGMFAAKQFPIKN